MKKISEPENASHVLINKLKCFFSSLEKFFFHSSQRMSLANVFVRLTAIRICISISSECFNLH